MFMEKRGSLIQFYSHNSNLVWDDSSFSGHSEIAGLFSRLPPMIFAVTGYDVQAIGGSPNWSMVMVFGTVERPNEGVHDFTSTFYVQLQENENTALIHCHFFKTLL